MCGKPPPKGTEELDIFQLLQNVQGSSDVASWPLLIISTFHIGAKLGEIFRQKFMGSRTNTYKNPRDVDNDKDIKLIMMISNDSTGWYNQPVFFVSQAQLKKMLILKPQFGVPHFPQFSGIKGFSPQNKTTPSWALLFTQSMVPSNQLPKTKPLGRLDD